MTTKLHILTRPADDLVTALIEAQRAAPENEVEVVDLTAPDPGYAALVEKVFAASSVATW
jgi:hypothetical protein